MESTKCRQVSAARYKKHVYKRYFKRKGKWGTTHKTHTRVIKELDYKSARNGRSIRCACLFAIAYALRVQVQRTSSLSHNVLIYLCVPI